MSIEKEDVAKIIIASGFTCASLLGCQSLLAAVGGVAAGLGVELLGGPAERGVHALFRNRALLNHDITGAFGRAFQTALLQLKDDWIRLQYKKLPEEERHNKQWTNQALNMLAEDIDFVLDPSTSLAEILKVEGPISLSSTASYSELKGNLKESVERYLFVAKRYAENKTFVTIDPSLSKDSFAYKTFLDENKRFLEFITEQLDLLWVKHFIEELKDPAEEGTRAWRACEMILYDIQIKNLTQVRTQSAETLEVVKWLKERVEKLEKQPIEHDLTGQLILDGALKNITNQLSIFATNFRDIQEGLAKVQSKIDINTDLTQKTYNEVQLSAPKLDVGFKLVVDEVRGLGKLIEESRSRNKPGATLNPSYEDVHSAYSLGIVISALLLNAQNSSLMSEIWGQIDDINHFVKKFASDVFTRDQYPSIHLLVERIVEQGESKLAAPLFIEAVTQLSSNYPPAMNVGYATGITMQQLKGFTGGEEALIPNHPFFEISFQLEFLSWYKAPLYKSLNIFPENFVNWYENILANKDFERSVNKISTWFDSLIA